MLRAHYKWHQSALSADLFH